MTGADRSLLDLLRRRIDREGPITIADYMAAALLHPSLGYYTTADRFGAAGDFTTAPEISQIFGELIGLWCADWWDRIGRPDPVLLVELGPGRGTLMQDALRAGRALPGFRAAVRVHLVEASPVLRAGQAERLRDAAPVWHQSLADLPDGPLLVIANEFFDALPIRQFQKTAAGWAERLVDADPDAPGLRFVLESRPGAGELLVPPPLRDAPVGSIAELCSAGAAVAAEIGTRIAGAGGAALIIDYGYPGPATGDTLQAVRHHRYAGVLDDPGQADLTAHVDFGALAEAARAAGVAVHGPSTQSDFLIRLGIGPRAEQLKRKATPTQSCDIDAALRRLLDGDQMGTLFKVIAVAAGDLGTPAGFLT